ncbi:MAG: DUF4403 family protein [Chitinophagales bacterium]
MTIFERVLGGNLFFDFWKQLQQYIFSEGRLIQLITLQPIEIYKTDTELEIDTAKVKLSIKSNVENLVQRRIDRALNLLTLNRAENDAKSFAYDFDVIIKAQMAYEEVSRFFNFHFANQIYPIEDNKYYLHIEKFVFSSEDSKAVVHMPFILESKRWFWKKRMNGTAVLRAYINFHQPKYVVKTRNLTYELETGSYVLKTIDNLYHKHLIEFLTGFLQYNFQEELFHAKTEAQQQINSFQSQTNWLNGVINDLDLERISLEKEGVSALFLAEGKLHLIR